MKLLSFDADAIVWLLFCFYNGNTFVSVIRDVVFKLPLPTDLVYPMRSLAAHLVAGTDLGDDLAQFSATCRMLEGA